MVQKHFSSFWTKDEWPGNSLDLNPIENIWGILKQSIDEMKQPNNLEQLKNQLDIAWKNIQPQWLENSVAGMPERINKCLRLNEDYIGK